MAWLGLASFAYLAGTVPFGYLAGRAKGVDLFAAGSRNVGATNAGRVLGWRWGVAVFALDFLKGLAPVALAAPLLNALEPGSGPAELARVVAAACAFLGHLYPVTLGFRGGKGVATGAGVVAVLLPGPFGLALAAWLLLFVVSETVSVASLAAATTLTTARLLSVPEPVGPDALPATLLCVAGSLVVVAKHRANVGRLWRGTESRFTLGAWRRPLVSGLHLTALGMWAGGGAFFQFVAAPTLFEALPQVVAASPSDRTAGVDIVPPGTSPEQRDALGKALFGAAVGPIFPKLFAWQAACAAVALVTAFAWRNGRLRLALIAAGTLGVAAGWPLSQHVSRLRLERFAADPEVAAHAVAAFGPWHVVSLLLAAVTVLLAAAALALGSRLPGPDQPGANRGSL